MEINFYCVTIINIETVYEVLEKMQQSENTAQFLQTFIHQPVAAALYKKVVLSSLVNVIMYTSQHFRETNRESLINLYDQEGDSLGAGIEYLIQCYSKKVCI